MTPTTRFVRIERGLARRRRARSTHATSRGRPSGRDPSPELRVSRHDRIDAHRAATIRYKSKLHHIGMGRALKGTRIILLVGWPQISITADSELLRDFELDPSRDYQRHGLG